MISREDFYKFLLDYKENYSGTGEYFHKNPQSDSQRVVSEYKKLIDETGYRIVRGPSKYAINSVDLYGRPDLDFRDLITYSQVTNKEFIVTVMKNNDNTETEYMPSTHPLFEKFVQSILNKHDTNYMDIEPYHTITAGGFTLSVHDIHCAFDEYAEPARLNKYVIGDLHVPYKSSSHSFSIGKRYSEEFCDVVEYVCEDIKPYFNIPFTPPDGVQRYSWDDLSNPGLKEFTVLDAACLTSTVIPDGFEKDIEKHKIIIDNLLRFNNHGASILVIRNLTQQRVTMTYQTVPKFKEFVEILGPITREIRSLL